MPKEKEPYYCPFAPGGICEEYTSDGAACDYCEPLADFEEATERFWNSDEDEGA